jgi:ABC-type transport system involved in multi-copper enzyme maturation permease subunit
MSSGLRVFFYKEWLAHRWVLLSLFVMCGVIFSSFVFLYLQDIAQFSASPFIGLGIFARSLSWVVAYVLCGRLIVAEYYSKTYLFLEILPLSRLKIVFVKWLIGLVCLQLFTLFFILMSLLLGAEKEVLTLRFLSVISVKALVFVSNSQFKIIQ